ncbi:MAG TPA: hypothetical protein HA346_02820 [Thermoplasmata archaeon]|nr:hypothetical protein [Thermoplasmata archaeon]
MRKVSIILLVWMMIFPAFSGCIGKEKEDLTAEDIAAKIRGEFWFAWKGYEKYAWGHDELRPLTRTYRVGMRNHLLLLL